MGETLSIRAWAAIGFAAVVIGLLAIANPTQAREDLDCSDFATQEEAQAVLEEDPSDPHRLDRDGDGIACESLPSGSGDNDQGSPGDGNRPAEDDTDNGEETLPETSGSTAIVAIAAAGALLSVGGGLWLLGRRRRIRFTA